ncbi:hypothetical protein ID866_7553 [Astraeus odoratus]|nr:hypothetical protein ID866_7553 [Astraeus odoratus]
MSSVPYGGTRIPLKSTLRKLKCLLCLIPIPSVTKKIVVSSSSRST